MKAPWTALLVTALLCGCAPDGGSISLGESPDEAGSLNWPLSVTYEITTLASPSLTAEYQTYSRTLKGSSWAEWTDQGTVPAVDGATPCLIRTGGVLQIGYEGCSGPRETLEQLSPGEYTGAGSLMRVNGGTSDDEMADAVRTESSDELAVTLGLSSDEVGSVSLSGTTTCEGMGLECDLPPQPHTIERIIHRPTGINLREVETFSARIVTKHLVVAISPLQDA